MKRLFCIVLAFFLAVGGAFSETDAELMRENEALRAELNALRARYEAVKNPSVVAVFDGGFVTFEEVFEEYQTVLEFYALFFGEEYREDADFAEELFLSVAEDIVREKVLDARLSGAELLTDEETAKVYAEAERAYLDMRNDCAQYYADETPEKALELADADMAEMDMDLESLISVYLSDARSEAAVRYLAGDVQVTEEDVQNLYEQQLEEDKAYYGEYPEEYVWVTDDDPAAWVPEGYRRARLLLVPFSEEQSAAFDELLAQLYEEEGDEAEIRAWMDEIYRQIEPEADKVSARFAAGEDFDSVLKDYGMAEEYLGEMGSPDGFLVSADNWYYEETLREAVLSLQNPGDVSERFTCDFGYLFAQYLSDVPSGARPFEEMKDALYREALEAKRQEIFENTVAAWVAEANPEYFFERMN